MFLLLSINIFCLLNEGKAVVEPTSIEPLIVLA